MNRCRGQLWRERDWLFMAMLCLLMATILALALLDPSCRRPERPRVRSRVVYQWIADEVSLASPPLTIIVQFHHG